MFFTGEVAAGPTVDDLMADALDVLCSLVGYAPRLTESSLNGLVSCFSVVAALPVGDAARQKQEQQQSSSQQSSHFHGKYSKRRERASRIWKHCS